MEVAVILSETGIHNSHRTYDLQTGRKRLNEDVDQHGPENKESYRSLKIKNPTSCPKIPHLGTRGRLYGKVLLQKVFIGRRRYVVSIGSRRKKHHTIEKRKKKF